MYFSHQGLYIYILVYVLQLVLDFDLVHVPSFGWRATVV